MLQIHFGLAGILGLPDAVWPLVLGVIDRTEERSGRTCERCGAPARLRDIDAEMMTLYDAHANGYEGA